MSKWQVPGKPQIRRYAPGRESGGGPDGPAASRAGYVNFIWPRVVGLAGPRLGARSQPRVNSGQLMGGSSCQWCRRRRRELVMTLTELRAMAAAAIIGDNSQPKAG